MAEYKLHKEHNLETLKRMADNSLDAVVTDAPYGLGKEPDPASLIKAWIDTGYMEIKGTGFMGKKWDAFVPQPAFWKEVFRVLKPGGYVLCFFGTRTYDWGTLALRLAGFEIRDCIQWIYGSGFPKSLDVSKALDKAAGKDREVVGNKIEPDGRCRVTEPFATSGDSRHKSAYGTFINSVENHQVTKPATEAAELWDGYGTALKPAYEPICVARKPLDGTVSENVLKHHCGGINLDECRIPFISETDKQSAIFGTGNDITGGNYGNGTRKTSETNIEPNIGGRFPSNVILDEFSGDIINHQSGMLNTCVNRKVKVQHGSNGMFTTHKAGQNTVTYNDIGGASRFFYCAKASPADRDYGLSGEARPAGFKNDSGRGIGGGYNETLRRNSHPTVKPISLMRYLVRLVKTPFSTCTIADFFLGSGTTGIACMLEDINFIGSESEEESFDTAEQRISFAKAEFLKEQAKPKQATLF